MPEQIFGVAFATAVRGLADDPRSERLVLDHLSEQPVNYLELLRWWAANSPLEPRASKHALDMLMARLAAEQLIEEGAGCPPSRVSSCPPGSPPSAVANGSA